MQLYNAEQIKEWDQFTIQKEGIDSIDLMERAANACVDYLLSISKKEDSVAIFCGKGNNGGDGLAIARLLVEKNYAVSVYELWSEKEGSIDFEINKKRWLDSDNTIQYIQNMEGFPNLAVNTWVVDALFGAGLNKPLSGMAHSLVDYLNTLSNTKVAIDVPSGMYLDKSSNGNTVLKANETLTFQQLKCCFLLADNAPFFGQVKVLDIGLSAEFKPQKNPLFELVDFFFAKNIYHPRSAYGNKGTFGHALLIAGNEGKMGAAVMCAKGCLRSGVGLLTCQVPRSESLILPITIPEAMSVFREEPVDFSKYKSIGIGPGLGITEEKLLKNVLDNAKVPLVLDADALNMLSQHPDWLSLIPENSILSPHSKEFERLFGQQENEYARIEKAIEISKNYPFVILLKGHHTLIAHNGKGYFNTTGNSGMATGGSGDTLTGILTSLLAQGYHGKDAAILGVYLHGFSADLALALQSEESLLPTDISDYLGSAFKKIQDYNA